jgi:predicted nucleic acid-binding protein
VSHQKTAGSFGVAGTPSAGTPQGYPGAGGKYPLVGQSESVARGSAVILVDTTVWVDFFRNDPTREKRAFEVFLQRGEMLCLTDIVLTEILRGTVKDREYDLVKHHLASFPCLTARAPQTYIHAADLYRVCRKKGANVRSTVDCLIAAVCLEHKVPLLHHDVDFDRLAKHCGLQTVDPSGVLPDGL